MAALGFNPVLAAVQTFVDYAMAIVGLLITWYIIKFFLVKPPTAEEKAVREAQDKEKFEHWRKWFNEEETERKEHHKKQSEHVQRTGKVEPIKGFLTKCINAMEEAVHLLESADADNMEPLHEVHKKLEVFNANIRHAWRELQHLRHYVPREDYTLVNYLAASAHKIVLDFLKKKWLHWDQAKLLAHKEELEKEWQEFYTTCGHLFQQLNEYLHNKEALLQAFEQTVAAHEVEHAAEHQAAAQHHGAHPQTVVTPTGVVVTDRRSHSGGGHH